MTWKSTPDAYGRIAITLHWLSALLIIGLMIAGFIAADTADPAAKAAILRFHVPIGILVLILTIARIVWRVFADRKPDEPPNLPRLQRLAAKLVHFALYAVIIGLAGSGIALLVMSGAGDILFGGAPGPLPDFWAFAPRYGHEIFARAMAVLLAAHVAAALYHQFVLKDRIFTRMGVGK